MSKEEVERLVEEAKKYEEEDKKRKDKIEDRIAAAEAAGPLLSAHNPHDCSNHDSTVAEACAGISRLSRGAGLVALSADGTTAGHAPAGHTDRAVVMTQATGSAPPSAAPPVLRI